MEDQVDPEELDSWLYQVVLAAEVCNVEKESIIADAIQAESIFLIVLNFFIIIFPFTLYYYF